MDLQLQAALQDLRKLKSDASPEELAQCASRLLLHALRCCGIAQKKLDFLKLELDYTMHWEKMLNPRPHPEPDQGKAAG
jgi:hypothetical protein